MKVTVPTSEAWRWANKPVKTFFGLNPSLLFIYLIVLFALQWGVIIPLAIATGLTVFFAFVEYNGIPAMMVFRMARTILMKNKKRVRPSWVKL